MNPERGLNFLPPALPAFVAVLFAIAFGGCTSLSRLNADNQEFVVNAFWAQDTLAHPNEAFRKINRMTPVIYKNSVVVGNAYDGLIAYDLDSRRELWRVPVPFGVEASATVIRDRLFVGGNNGRMYSVDLATGQVVWTFDTKSELVAEPLLHDGILYFISGSQSLYALDASNGKQMWIHNRQDTSNVMTVRGGSKPAIAGGLIYAGFSDGTLVALNAATGTEQWEITLNRNTRFKDIDSSPVIDGDVIYINSYDDRVYCVSKDKGDILWSAPFGGISTPLISGEKLLVTSSRGELAALEKSSGRELWKYSSKHGILTDPLLHAGLVTAGESQGKLLFFSAENGRVIASFEPGRGVFSKPASYGDSLYFISGEGNVYGLKAYYSNKSRIEYLK